MEILRDPIFWQFLGALLALVGIISVFVIYIFQRKKKSLSYEILTSNELLTSSEELRGRIRITFNKKPVQNIHLLIISIKNDGNVSIIPSDFYEEFTCSFGDHTKILTAEITDCFPDSFKPQIEIREDSLTIAPVLINSKDFFIIKFLLSKFDGIVKVKGRISGIHEIKKLRKANFLRWIQPIGLIFLAFSLFAAGSGALDTVSLQVRMSVTILLLFLSVALVIGLALYLNRFYD